MTWDPWAGAREANAEIRAGKLAAQRAERIEVLALVDAIRRERAPKITVTPSYRSPSPVARAGEYTRPAVCLPAEDFATSYAAWRGDNAQSTTFDEVWVKSKIALRRKFLQARAELAGLPNFADEKDDMKAIRGLQAALTRSRAFAI